ncbi:MAG: FAD-dependent oxidoreductase, partial [Clostridia bacterium]|nr:FAD-dependent oxidoreductase [Clostridia bacterium]
IYDNVVATNLASKVKVITTENSGEIRAKAVILCAGATPRKLNIPLEDKFTGRGVSYCAVCDGAFYRDKKVVVVGGGNTAVSDCLYLTKFAKEVHLVHRRDKLRASKIEIDRLISSNVIIHYNSVVEAIIAEDKITGVILSNTANDDKTELAIDGLFVAIGGVPNSNDIANEVARDDYGYFIADEDMKTNIEGVFVAGDVRQKKVRQVITACSDGAIAGEMAGLYIQGLD